ncbi:phenylacetate--CoA ligase family protein [Bizionia sp. KMM 8389]
MKEKIYNHAPNGVQNLMVSLFNILAYKKIYGGKYKAYRKLYLKNRTLTRQELSDIQEKRYTKFVENVQNRSQFYNDLHKHILNSNKIENIVRLPIVNKEMLRANIKDVSVSGNKKVMVFKTGGTTGKSLEVKCTQANIQERFAMLDDFRSRAGYELGKNTAWFSGKNLLSQRDIRKKRFWKTDYYHKVRYYSTFHIKNEYLKYYVEDLMKFQPEFLVGFPSTILEIAKYGLEHGYNFPENTVKAVFPTAETITKAMRDDIETFFKTKLYNQYASSEGAPFIFECKKGHLHLELQCGVYEVLDEKNQPSNSGKLVVTSFTTEGTPLIRYDIGDQITLDHTEKTCSCGNNNPIVLEINGRVDDYIYSSDTGKVNLGNISNTLKGTSGIKNFQVIQNSLNTLEINVRVDESVFTKEVEKKFLKNWRDRVGEQMEIKLNYVQDIPLESSGKYRMVKNNIKHLLNA